MPAPLLVSLEQAKAHLRVSHDDEDADILLKLSAATEQAVNFLDRTVYASESDMAAAVATGQGGIEPMVCTDMIRAAILLILGDLYGNREEVITGTIATQLPTGARACLLPHRRMGC